MALMTEFFASHGVPRLSIGSSVNSPDGYGWTRGNIPVGSDGYVLDLRINSTYSLLTEDGYLHYAIASDNEIAVVGVSRALQLLNYSPTVINGHKLLVNERVLIQTTPKCSKLLMKSAPGALVSIGILGSFIDPPDNGR